MQSPTPSGPLRAYRATIALALLSWSAAAAAQAPAPPTDVPAAPATPAPKTPAPKAPAPKAPAPKAPAPAAPTTTPAPAAPPPAVPEHTHLAARSPGELLKIAMAYVSLADSNGDPWDALLALTYFERARSIHPKLATPQLLDTMKRMRRLAGKRPYAPPVPGARYPVYFSAYEGDDEYEVDTDEGSCVTPCTLEMTPGPHFLRAGGGIETELFIPTAQSRVRLQADTDTKTTAGAVLVPTGTLIGAGMWALGLTCNDDTCRTANFSLWPLLGAGMLTTGIVLLAIAEDVPLDANRAENVGLAPVITPDSSGRLRATGAMGTLSVAF